MENEGLEITLRYVDESELIGQFGTTVNPFLSTYYRAQFQRIIVFELNIINGGASSFKFDSNHCTLVFGGKNVEADNPFKLTNYWEQLDDSSRDTNRKIDIIKKYMLPGREEITVGEELSGYLVFRASGLPREGEGEVSIYGGSGRRFEFLYNFTFLE